MNKTYQKTARDLKKLGLIDYDLRKELSSGQKSRITKLRQEYGHFLKHPEIFHAPTVSAKTAKDLKASGYKVTPKGRAIIPLHDFQSANVEKGKIIFKSGRMKETVYLHTHKTFFQKLKALSTKKLSPNEMLTAQLDSDQPFKRSRFGSYAELYHYLSVHYAKDASKKEKDELIARLSIVHVYSPRKEAHAKKKATPKKKRRN